MTQKGPDAGDAWVDTSFEHPLVSATIASFFVKADRSSETSSITETLARIEADLAALKTQLETR